MKNIICYFCIFFISTFYCFADELINPNPYPGDGFGSSIEVLKNGNIVVAVPNATVNGKYQCGAVYLYDGKTNQLKNYVYGTQSYNHIGKQIIFSDDNKYIMYSPYIYNYPNFNDYITLIDGDQGLSGEINETNSLVLKNSMNSGKQEVIYTKLDDGKYIFQLRPIDIPLNSINKVSMWIIYVLDPKNYKTEEIDSTNALLTYDYPVIKKLKSGGFLVLAGANNDYFNIQGGVTRFFKDKKVTGFISSKNSLISSKNSSVGYFGFYEFNSGDYLLFSRFNKNGKEVGAITYCYKDKPLADSINEENSIIGNGVNILLTEKNYSTIPKFTTLQNYPFFNIYEFDNGDWAFSNHTFRKDKDTLGLIFFQTKNFKPGVLYDSLCIIGNKEVGHIGGGEIRRLNNGDIIICNPFSAPYGITYSGSVSLFKAGEPLRGYIKKENCFYSETPYSFVGSGGVVPFDGGSFIISSPFYSMDKMSSVGAITVFRKDKPVQGVLDFFNSTISVQSNDKIGIGGIIKITDGQFAILSPFYNGKTGYKNILTGALHLSNIQYDNTGFINQTECFIGRDNSQIGYGGYIKVDSVNIILISPNYISCLNLNDKLPTSINSMNSIETYSGSNDSTSIFKYTEDVYISKLANTFLTFKAKNPITKQNSYSSIKYKLIDSGFVIISPTYKHQVSLISINNKNNNNNKYINIEEYQCNSLFFSGEYGFNFNNINNYLYLGLPFYKTPGRILLLNPFTAGQSFDTTYICKPFRPNSGLDFYLNNKNELEVDWYEEGEGSMLLVSDMRFPDSTDALKMFNMAPNYDYLKADSLNNIKLMYKDRYKNQTCTNLPKNKTLYFSVFGFNHFQYPVFNFDSAYHSKNTYFIKGPVEPPKDTTSKDTTKNKVYAAFKINNLYPNPAKDNIEIKIETAKQSHLTIDIIDETGRLINLYTNIINLGERSINLNISSLSCGVYRLLVSNGINSILMPISIIR